MIFAAWIGLICGFWLGWSARGEAKRPSTYEDLVPPEPRPAEVHIDPDKTPLVVRRRYKYEDED